VWCDDCGDIVAISKPIIIAYPNGKSKKAIKDLVELIQGYGFDVLEILVCLDCWNKNFKDSRKKQVASMLRILKDK
jgi:chitinase